jgi:hypothetical protein
MAMDKKELDRLLDRYKDLPAGFEYQKAMAAYQAAARAYNDISRKIDTLWTEVLQIGSDRVATQKQLEETKVRLQLCGPFGPFGPACLVPLVLGVRSCEQ